MKTLDLVASFKFKTNTLDKSEHPMSENTIKINWKYKRIMLHIIWGALNVLSLVYMLTLFIDSDWGVLFLIVGLIYCSLYWLITSILFDILIGDEIDNNLEPS